MSKLVIVKVENFEGNDTSLTITDSTGYPLKAMYLIGVLNDDGIVEVDDYGYMDYMSAAEAAKSE
jgi:hypothetical protein